MVPLAPLVLQVPALLGLVLLALLVQTVSVSVLVPLALLVLQVSALSAL